MGFHLLASTGTATASVTNLALAGVADPEFTRQGSGSTFRFSEDYQLIINMALGKEMTDMRLNMPSVNAIARHHIRPLHIASGVSVTVNTNPNVQDLRDYPLQLPRYEDLVWETTKGATSESAIHIVLNWITPPGWNRNLPRGERRLVIRATASAAGTANVWGALASLTFAENLRSGWYALVGCQVFDAATVAFRLNFARPEVVNGRKLRPGGVCEEAQGNVPLAFQMGGLGQWGMFHSAEPPQIEILANATASSAQVLDMDVIYLGNSGPGAM